MQDLLSLHGKKVFVTGHTGFKGTWLCRILLKAGAEITGYSLDPSVEKTLFSLTNTKKNINSIIGDVRNGGNLSKVLQQAKPDIVLHLAAQPIVRISYRDPVGTYETNVMGTVNILEASRHCDSVKSFVNITTDKVYLNREWVWGYREDERLCGLDPYSNSKSCSELVSYSYKNSFFGDVNFPAISTARSGNVIGGGDFAPDRIIPDCIRAAEKGMEIIVRNPHSTRPYQHVLECLSGYLLLAQKQMEDASFAGAYNFGPDDESCVTTGELVDLFCRSWGSGLTWKVQGDGGPHEASYLKLDCAKAKSILNWKPKWQITKAVGKIVDFHKALLAGVLPEEMIDRQINEYFCG